MNQVEREVRAAVYRLFVSGQRRVGPGELAAETGFAVPTVADALDQLSAEKRLAIQDGSVVMAHPFSGVDTGHYSIIEDRVYWANCAWDALAILSLLGDGEAVCRTGPTWTVTEGKVSPEGLVNLVVPARGFWDDVGFT